jgi:outer membrane lipopolysaccharide assembly protein LptE/RlpB
MFLVPAGCGYRLAAHADLKGKAVTIPVFANKTLRPNLETCVTRGVVEQFAGPGGARIVAPDEAELELAGAVLTYSEAASAFTAADQVAMYQLVMTAEGTLRQTPSGKVLWKGTVRAVQDYPTNTNIALKINAQESAQRELCRKLAESILRESGNHF